MKAAAAQIDITPRAGVHLAGDVVRHRPAKLVGDPLYAKALVLESAGRKACFVALDVTIVTRPYSDRIRQAASERFGFDPSAVLVHATQTHSAPPLGHFMVDPDFEGLPPAHEWLAGGETAYSDWAAERAVEAIARGHESLEPVQVGVASGIEGRWAHNRRAVMRDGTVGMPGPTWPGGVGPTWIRYLEGPIDPELGVMCFRTDDLRLSAMLMHYTCHPVHVFPKCIVSADWPGAWCDELRRTHGADCVPLVLNGCCGNINPWPPYDPDYVEDHRTMGRALAKTAETVIESLAFTGASNLAWTSRHAKLPLREVPPDELKWAEDVLARDPQPTWTDDSRTTANPEWVAAASIYSVELMRRRDTLLDYEIQAFRVGDTAFVGLPGEPFVEGQLAIKLASPAYPTYVAHCCTEYVGYIPTADALRRGGHEVNTRYWAKLTPEALDLIVASATDALRELFP